MNTRRIHPLLLFFLIWPTGMGILGVVLGLFLSAIIKAPLWITFLISLFNTLTISFWPVASSMVFLAGIYNRKPGRDKARGSSVSPAIVFAGYSFFVILAALLGDRVNRLLLTLLFDPKILAPGLAVLQVQWIPSLLLTLLISWPFYFARSYLHSYHQPDMWKSGKDGNGIGTENAAQIESDGDSHSLRILMRRQETEIVFGDIVYLTAFNKKSILHTTKRDLEISETLKSIRERLPAPQFLRIHKSYAINMDYLGTLDHVKNGIYRLVLSDEDETSLPVGRSYLEELRRILRSSGKDAS